MVPVLLVWLFLQGKQVDTSDNMDINLFLSCSDVDINIDFETMPKNNPVDVLKVIRKECIRQHIFTFRDTQLVAHAKVEAYFFDQEEKN